MRFSGRRFFLRSLRGPIRGSRVCIRPSLLAGPSMGSPGGQVQGTPAKVSCKGTSSFTSDPTTGDCPPTGCHCLPRGAPFDACLVFDGHRGRSRNGGARTASGATVLEERHCLPSSPLWFLMIEEVAPTGPVRKHDAYHSDRGAVFIHEHMVAPVSDRRGIAVHVRSWNCLRRGCLRRSGHR